MMKFSIAVASCMLVSAAAYANVTCGEYESHPMEGGAQGKLDSGLPYAVTHGHNMVNAKDGGKYDGLSGHCGSFVTMFDNGAYVSGACTLADKDGDIAMYHYVLRRGQQRGRFTRDGGTGKFAKSFETGWFQQTSQDQNGAKGIWGGKTAAVCK